MHNPAYLRAYQSHKPIYLRRYLFLAQAYLLVCLSSAQAYIVCVRLFPLQRYIPNACVSIYCASLNTCVPTFYTSPYTVCTYISVC